MAGSRQRSGWAGPAARGTSTGDAGTDRWAGRACAPVPAGAHRSRARWPTMYALARASVIWRWSAMFRRKRRDRPRRGGRVRPCPHGRGGEHRLRADLQQHRAVEIGQCAHTFGELDRLPRMAAPVGAVQFRTFCRGPRRCGCTPMSFVANRTRTGSHTTRTRRGPDPAAPNGRRGWCLASHSAHRRRSSPATAWSRSCVGSRQHGVGAVVGGHRQARELVGQAFHPLGGGEYRDHPTARQASCRTGGRARPATGLRPRD